MCFGGAGYTRLWAGLDSGPPGLGGDQAHPVWGRGLFQLPSGAKTPAEAPGCKPCPSVLALEGC